MPNQTERDPLGDLTAAGVAVWLDDLSRELLAGGRLQTLAASRHVVGVTTNPTIFASALSQGDRYDAQLAGLAADGADVDAAVLAVTTDDVRAACDVLAPVQAQTAGLDGCVSIEVDPRLSRDAAATAEMARRLWAVVDRDNLYIKIPATEEGLAAITEVISQGISVNVTLIFSLDRYRAVMDAYLSGLELAHEAGRDLASIRSVASFFISRVDAEVDARLDQLGTPEAAALKGSAAIANGRLAYEAHEQLTVTETLAAARAPRGTAAAAAVGLHRRQGSRLPGHQVRHRADRARHRQHHARADPGSLRRPRPGQPGHHTGSYDAARDFLGHLAAAGIDFGEVTEFLERDGLAKFEKSWSELGATIAAELERPRRGPQS